MVTCGVAVSRLLIQHGVEVVFGIPGNHTLELYRGLDDSPIRHVTSRHEQGAAFMADGYARASGRAGVCLLISGPGLLNAATAIAQARADSIPMLVISAVAGRAQQGKGLGLLHELPNQQAAARGFCTQSLSLTRAEDLPALLDYVFTAFARQRPGPIHLEIPLDLMTESIELDQLPKTPVPALATDLQIPTEALACLNSAKQPLLLLGGGSVIAGRRALTALAECLDAPVIQTTNAKGLIPRDHPLFVGGSPSLPAVQQALNNADVLLAIGTEFGETDYDLLMTEPLALRGKLVRVDIDPIQLTRNQIPNFEIVGDAADVVRLLHGQIHARVPGNGAARAQTLRQSIQSEAHYHPQMARFFAVLQAESELLVVGDSTRPTYYATWQYEPDRPRGYFHSVSGFGTLGYAIPAAIGARLGSRGPVLALIGDGGAQFTLPELATARDSDIAVTFLIWCNRGYEEIENSLKVRGVSNRSTDISSPDFTLIGEAYGLTVYQPRSWADLSRALTQALAEPKANLLLLDQERFITQPSGQWYT
ncbi:MAG: 5-guanidino-2-oxopentanoate decarboxylase [Pseudomonadales bacterium]